MTNEQQSEWTAQALVAGGAVLLLLAAFWMGVYAPNAKMISDDFETTYEYEGILKVLDSGNKTGQGEPGAFQTMQFDNEGCACDTFGGAALWHILTADPKQSTDDETFYHEAVNVYATPDDGDGDGLPDAYLFSLKDSNSWLDRTTYESRGEGTSTDDYDYSTWSPNNLPVKETTLAPNPFVSGHTNTYMFETTEDVDGLEAYVYVADETGTNIEYMPATTSPLHALSTELGATFYISYYERVKVDSESGTTLDRDLDITVYATFPDFYAAGNYGLLYLTDGAHFPSETTYTGTLFDLANGLDVNVTAIKTTSVVTAMPGPDNTTVDPTTATHLLTNTGFAVNTDMVVGVDNDGNPVVATIDLNADGSLVAPANMFVDRSTHQVGSPQTGFANTFPHSNTDTAAPGFFPNPFDSSYNNMYTLVGVDATTGIAHFSGVSINETGVPVQIPRGVLYIYVDITTGGTIQSPDPLPDSMMYHPDLNPNGTYITPPAPYPSTVPILMDYAEDLYFDPYTGTVQNQVYSVTGYVDSDFSGSLTENDTVVQTLNVEYSDAQKAAYPAAMGQKAFAQFYSARTIPVMVLNGGYTEAEVTESVDTATERTSNLKMADTYVPGTLIVLALGCLIGGFYIYYQEGEGGGGAPAAAPEPAVDEGGDDDGAGDGDSGDSGDDDSGGDKESGD